MNQKTRQTSDAAALKAKIAQRFVDITLVESGRRLIVGSGDKRSGMRGIQVATIGLKHSSGYEVILQMDNGKLESFAPMQLFPDTND